MSNQNMEAYTQKLALAILQKDNAKDLANEVLFWAAKSGHADVVEMIIPHTDPKANASYALRLAADGGHAEAVALLIPVSDCEKSDSIALSDAAQNGHTEVVRQLIPVSNPKANGSRALKVAAANGHVEAVKLLIPVSDIGRQEGLYSGCDPVWQAAVNGHTECFKLLAPFSDMPEIFPGLLHEAALRGEVEIAKVLINDYASKINPKKLKGILRQALIVAAADMPWTRNNKKSESHSQSRAELIDLLLPLTDPKADKTPALLAAVRTRNKHAVEKLIPHGDVKKLMKSLPLPYQKYLSDTIDRLSGNPPAASKKGVSGSHSIELAASTARPIRKKAP